MDSSMRGTDAAVLAGGTATPAGAARTAWHLLRGGAWLKNLFIFAGLLFQGPPFSPRALAHAALAFVLFSAAASAVYIHNDIADRAADVRHPRKRHRPIAAGRVPLPVARALQGLLLLAAFGGALALPARFAWLVGAYAGLNVLYSGVLKHVVILDVMALAAGFVLRVEAGCAAVGAEASAWILLCTFLLALLMGCGKRRHELLLPGRVTPDHRPVLGLYSRGLLDQMIVISSACTIVAYALFTTSWRTVAVHGTTDLVYTVPIVVYGVFRYQLLILHGGGGGDPAELVVNDPPLLATVVLWFIACVVVLYWP
jgi:heme O synthase-like polyprenyltransferase